MSTTEQKAARWYAVDIDGAATLCVDQADAEQVAKTAQAAWPHLGPHRAVQLVEAPLMGAAGDGWLQDGSLLYRLTDDRQPENRDEINVTMVDGSRSLESRTRRASELLDRIRATPPSSAKGVAHGPE